MTKKIFLLDANVLVDYYLRQEPKIIETMRELRKKRYEGKCLLFIPNFCVAEVFSTFARNIYSKAMSGKFVKDAKEIFIDEVSRDYEYKRYQYYCHIELNRYHLLHAHLVYKPTWEYVYKNRNNYRDKKGNLKPPPSTFDLLVIAQGIEMTSLYSDEEFALLTSDAWMIDICNYLHELTDEQKYALVNRNNDNNKNIPENLSSYKYPKILNARNTGEINQFLNS